MAEKEQNLGNINHIADDIVFNGNLTFSEKLTISGLVLGKITSKDGTVDITKHGQADGNLSLDILNNRGKVSGSVHANKVTLFTQSISQSDITVNELVIEKGAKLSGQVKMTD